MLVLKIKRGERVWIGDALVEVIDAGSTWVRIGVQAPRTVRVLREKLAARAAALTEEGSENGNPTVQSRESGAAESPASAGGEARPLAGGSE